MSLYLYLEASLGFFFQRGYDIFGPNSYVFVLNIFPAYVMKIIHSAVGIVSLNSLRLHAIISASEYDLTIIL
jgi:hypothetical protein